MNGDARTQHDAMPSGYSDMMDRPAITVNFGLTGRQIWAFVLSVPTTIAALGVTGIFFMPAKQQDMSIVQQQMTSVSAAVADLQAGMKESRQATEKLADVLGGLEGSIAHLQQTMDERTLYQAPAAGQAPRQARAAPKRKAAPRASGTASVLPGSPAQ